MLSERFEQSLPHPELASSQDLVAKLLTVRVLCRQPVEMSEQLVVGHTRAVLTRYGLF